MCLSVTEGAEMLNAADRSDVILMVGYPKRYSPAYRRARETVGRLDDLRFVRVTTLEAPFEPYVAHHQIVRPDDISAEQVEAWRADSESRIDAAVGPASRRGPGHIPRRSSRHDGPRIQPAARDAR